MFLTIGLIPIFSRVAIKLHIVDEPNERKVHFAPIPRIGGMAMAVGILLSFFLQNLNSHTYKAILVGTLIIVTFGMVDDIFGIGYRLKFLAQISAAMVLIIYGDLTINDLGSCLPEGCFIPDWVSYPFTLLVIVAVTNAVNLADGLDGLAAGIMLQVFFCLTLMGIQSSTIFVSVVSLGVIGAILGFLRFNTYPAKIFMGDTGSQMLGFLAIALLLMISQSGGAISPLIPLLLLGFPVIDTGIVLIGRLARGAPPFKADQTHFHHRLLKVGFYHNEVVFLVYSFQAIFVICAYLLRYYNEWWLVMYCIFLCLSLMVPVYYADYHGIKLRRKSFFDTLLKPFLRTQVKERFIFLRMLQPVLEYGLPLCFLATTFLPAQIPSELGFIALILFTALSADLWFRLKWTTTIIRVSLYIVLPIIIYVSLVPSPIRLDTFGLRMCIVASTLIGLSSILVLKLTRRRSGFRPTPTDYLIVLFALVLGVLSKQQALNDQVGFWATFLLLFFFSTEVLLGEVRSKVRPLGFMFLPSLIVLIVRGIQALINV